MPVWMCVRFQGTQGTSLNDLLGTWEFVTTIDASIFRDHYLLSSVVIVDGAPAIIGGIDLDDGGLLIACSVRAGEGELPL